MPETGVKGLLQFIVNNAETRERTSVSRLKEKIFSKTQKKPLLLCDYYAVITWLLSRADLLAIQQKRLSPYSLLFGGNFRSYGVVVTKLVESLQRLGVEPLFFVDGPPGIDRDETRLKFYGLRERHLEQLEQNHVIQQVCEGKRDILQVPWRLREAISLEVELLLRTMSVSLHYCPGDANLAIMQYLYSHEEVCGVLSADITFATIPSVQLLHLDFFDPDNHLIVLAKSSMAPPLILDHPPTPSLSPWGEQKGDGGEPFDITCEVTSAELLSQVLGLEVSQLVDLSILCGNSYTRELNNFISTWGLLGIADLQVETVAKWLSRETIPLLSNPVIKEICAQVPTYLEAILHSYKLCRGGRGADIRQQSSQVEPGNLVGLPLPPPPPPPTSLSVHWRPVVVEAITLGQPCIGDLTLPLRKVQYALLGRQRVIEFGQVGNKTFAELGVVLDSVSPRNMDPLRFFQGLLLRERMGTLLVLLTFGHHLLERGESLLTILSHAIVTGRTLKEPVLCHGVLVCSCLLLMTELNGRGQPSPSIRISELEALIVTCLLCCAGLPPCHTPSLPGMRAVTVASWFTSLLEHAYQMAHLICMPHELPRPSECFYGLAYVPLHVVTVNQSQPESLSPNLMEARAIFNHIINLPSVLALRSFVLNKGHQYELQSILDAFAVALRDVSGNSAILTPKEELSVTLPLEVQYKLNREVLHLLTCKEEPKELEEQVTGSSSLTQDQNCSFEPYCLESSCATHDSDILLEGEEEEEEQEGTSEVNSEALSEAFECKEEKGQVHPSMGARPYKEKSKVKLPVVDHQENILELIRKYRVVCIQGETGCGKSTKVPQFVLEDSPRCKVLVSQPRRVAAIKLAERVAAERQEPLGRTVGFVVSGERRREGDTAIVYCTMGYLLQMLVHDPLRVGGYTHVILDEIHERSVEADFAMLVLRKLASEMLHLKIVLMSATMQMGLVIQYFRETLGEEQVSTPYFVGSKLFPVETYFLDELEALVGRRNGEEEFWHCSQQKAASMLKVLATRVLSVNQDSSSSWHRRTGTVWTKPEVTFYMKNVCTEIIVSQATLGGAVLVFLPGMADIVSYYESLTGELGNRGLSEYFSLFMLHSQVPLQEQRAAFCAPPPDKVHVILATNIAESSVTLPGLSLVVDFGIYRQLEYDSKRHMACLSHRWCSRASCSQRAGRVGRVCAGTAVHLVTRRFHDAVLPEFDLAAMATAPLSKLVLQAKQIGSKIGVPSVTQLLSQAVEPPSLQQLEAALRDLASMGAISAIPGAEISEEAPITLLGYVGLSLPVELPLARLVFLGVLFGVPCDGVVLAAALSLDQDVFTLPSRVVMDNEKYHASLLRSMKWRDHYDGSNYSEPLAMCRMFRDFLWFKADCWRRKKGEGGGGRGKESRSQHARLFSHYTAVRYDKLLQLETVVGDIASRLLGHLEEDCPAHLELRNLVQWVFPSLRKRKKGDEDMPTFCDSPDLLKALLTASFCHQTVFGVTQCNSCFKWERDQAVRLLDAVKDLGMAYTRTIAFKNLKNVTQLDLDTVARHILPHLHCQTLIEEGLGLIQVNGSSEFPCPEEKPLWSPSTPCAAGLQNEVLCTPFPFSCGSGDDGDDLSSTCQGGGVVMSHPAPFELRLLWQYGERRVTWRAKSDTVELTRPVHPCTMTWYRANTEKDHVIPGSWRNPTGFMCELDPCDSPLFAIPFVLQGTFCRGSNSLPSIIFARGLTVLPSLRHSPLAMQLLLAFQPRGVRVDLLVDGGRGEVLGARVNSCLVMLSPHKLTTADIFRANLLRFLISDVMGSISISSSSFSSEGGRTIIPSDKAALVSWILQDLMDGSFDHCPILQHYLSTKVNPESTTTATIGVGPSEPVWEVASFKSCDVEGGEGTVVDSSHHEGSLAFELFPLLRCSLVKGATPEGAVPLLMGSVEGGISSRGWRTPGGSPELAVFELSPDAPPFTPGHVLLNKAVKGSPSAKSSSPAILGPTQPIGNSRLPFGHVSNLSNNCFSEPLPVSTSTAIHVAPRLGCGPSPHSQRHSPPSHVPPFLHHPTVISPSTSPCGPFPRFCVPRPFSSTSFPFQLHQPGSTPPLTEYHPLHGCLGERQSHWGSRMSPPATASSPFPGHSSLSSLHKTPEMQATMILLSTLFGTTALLPVPSSPPGGKPPGRPPTCEQDQVSDAHSPKPSIPLLGVLPTTTTPTTRISPLCGPPTETGLQHWLKVGHSVAGGVTGGVSPLTPKLRRARKLSDHPPPISSPSPAPPIPSPFSAPPIPSPFLAPPISSPSPALLRCQKPPHNEALDSPNPYAGVVEPYAGVVEHLQTSPCKPPVVTPEEQRLVSFMIDYIASHRNCVSFNQLCWDAYPSFKQRYSIEGSQESLTLHFFVRHPDLFVVFGYPGCCVVQLVASHPPRGLVTAVLGGASSADKVGQECETESSFPLKTERSTKGTQQSVGEFTEEIQPSQEEFTEEIQPSQGEFTEEIQPSQEKFTEEIQPSREEFTEEILPSQKEFTEQIQPLQKEFTEEIQPLQKEFTEQILPSQGEFTEQILPSQGEFTERVQLSQEKFTEEIQPLQKEFTEQILPSQEEFTEQIQPSQKEFTEQIQPSQEEFTEEIQPSQKEFTEQIQPSQEEFAEQIQPSQGEFTEPEQIQPSQEEFTEQIQPLQGEFTEQIQPLQGEITEQIQEFTEEVQSSQGKFTEQIQPPQGEFTEQIQPLQGELTEQIQEFTEEVHLSGMNIINDIVPQTIRAEMEQKGVGDLESTQDQSVPQSQSNNTHVVQTTPAEEAFGIQDVGGASPDGTAETKEIFISQNVGGARQGVVHNTSATVLAPGSGTVPKTSPFFLDPSLLDPEWPLLFQSSELTELQQLLHSISLSCGHVTSAQHTSTPNQAGMDDLLLASATPTSHVTSAQHTSTPNQAGRNDLLLASAIPASHVQESASTLTWASDMPVVGVYPRGSPSRGPLSPSPLDIPLGEEWFDFSSFVTPSAGNPVCPPIPLGVTPSAGNPVCPPIPLGMPSCAGVQEGMTPGGCGMWTEGTKSMENSLSSIFGGDGRESILFEVIGDSNETTLAGGAACDHVGITPPCDRSLLAPGAASDAVEHPNGAVEHPNGMSAVVDGFCSADEALVDEELSPGNSEHLKVICQKDKDIHLSSADLQSVQLSCCDVASLSSISTEQHDSEKWEEEPWEERKGVSITNQTPTPSTKGSPAIPGTVGGGTGNHHEQCTDGGVGRSMQSCGHPLGKPLVPYHLLDRQKRFQPGTMCYKLSYFMDYLFFLGGGAHYDVLVQVFKEHYCPRFRATAGNLLKFFREMQECFIVLEVPDGYFIRLQTLTYAPEASVSIEIKKCDFIVTACRALAYEEEGLSLGTLKDIPDLVQKVMPLNVGLLKVLQSCRDFFVVSKSGDSDFCVKLTSKATAVQHEFLQYCRKELGTASKDKCALRGASQSCGRTQRLKSRIEVATLSPCKAAILPTPVSGAECVCNEGGVSNPVTHENSKKKSNGESYSERAANIDAPYNARKKTKSRKERYASKLIINKDLLKGRDGYSAKERPVSIDAACEDAPKPKLRSSTKKVTFHPDTQK